MLLSFFFHVLYFVLNALFHLLKAWLVVYSSNEHYISAICIMGLEYDHNPPGMMIHESLIRVTTSYGI